MAFIVEEPPNVRHVAPSLTFEEFLEFHNVSILETNENMRSIVDENKAEIGPFTNIEYDGFLQLGIDIRDAKNFPTRSPFPVKYMLCIQQKLERLFGRNSFKLNTVIGSRHRMDPSPNLTIEPLSSISLRSITSLIFRI